MEINFNATGFAPAKRKTNKNNKISYTIDQAVDAHNKKSNNRNVVLVHCAMGRSRSATCVIMYIMKKFGIGYEDTLEFVKSRREVVDPNEGFLRQLREFEEQGMDFGDKHNANSRDSDVACLV
jgi:protein-tyrosine phosphatase